MIKEYTFTSDDQDEDFNFVLVHSLGTANILPAWKDSNGIFQIVAGICHFGDATGADTTNKITFMCGSAVTGTNTIILSYNSSTENLTSKKLFEQTAITLEPEDSDRFALGQSGKSLFNLTYSKLKEFLTSAVGSNFFKVQDSPFSEIASATNRQKYARANLSIYSRAESDAKYLSITKASQLNSSLNIRANFTLGTYDSNYIQSVYVQECVSLANFVHINLRVDVKPSGINVLRLIGTLPISDLYPANNLYFTAHPTQVNIQEPAYGTISKTDGKIYLDAGNNLDDTSYWIVDVIYPIANPISI